MRDPAGFGFTVPTLPLAHPPRRVRGEVFHFDEGDAGLFIERLLPNVEEYVNDDGTTEQSFEWWWSHVTYVQWLPPVTAAQVERVTEEPPPVSALAELTAAEMLVIADQQAGDWSIDPYEALYHVINTIRLPEDEPVAGAVALEEDGSRLARAYRLVLEDDSRCEGHESLAGEHMGEAVYCDGSCRLA